MEVAMAMANMMWQDILADLPHPLTFLAVLRFCLNFVVIVTILLTVGVFVALEWTFGDIVASAVRVAAGFLCFI